ncbi:MAG: 3-hydroxyacyl-CoA dehydrogenase family protein [Halolamina sp.]
MTDVNRVAIVGGGIMGSGIGQALLQGGYEVAIRDVEEELLEEARDHIVTGNYGLDRAVESGHLTEAEKAAALDRLALTTDIGEAVDGADIVIEAVPEELAIKGQVFRELDDVTDDVPLYSNTSGFSITSIANAVDDPSRVAGAHFFNPAQIMDLVEVVETEQTDEALVEMMVDLCEDIGKDPIVVEDAPGEYGFVANRCFGALVDEAKRIVEEGVATQEQVDEALEKGYNFPVGPFSFTGIGEEWE